MPRALRSIQLADESVPELSILCSFDDDVLGQMTVTGSRIRSLLTQIHPALEWVIGPHLGHPAMLDLLQHDPSPAAMKTVGTARIATQLLKLPPRMGRRLAGEITQALLEQAVVVVGTTVAATVLPSVAEQLMALRRQRTEIALAVEKLVDAHPPSHLDEYARSRRQDRSPTPHRSRRQALRIRRPLASHAGFAPVTRWPGSSIHGEHASWRGNKSLTGALFLLAMLRDGILNEIDDALAGHQTTEGRPNAHHVNANASPDSRYRSSVTGQTKTPSPSSRSAAPARPTQPILFAGTPATSA